MTIARGLILSQRRHQVDSAVNSSVEKQSQFNPAFMKP